MLVMDKVIKRLRMKRGISQSALAKSVGVQQSTISRIENSCYNPSIDLITKILLFLRISEQDFNNELNKLWNAKYHNFLFSLLKDERTRKAMIESPDQLVGAIKTFVNSRYGSISH